MGTGDGGFLTPTDINGLGVNRAQYPDALAAGDLNGDGRLDLVATGWQDGRVAVLLGAGDGTFSEAMNVRPTGAPADLMGVAVADLNGDGRPDLALAGITSGFTVLLNDGTCFATTTGCPSSNFADTGDEAVAVGDLNGDGRPDVLLAKSGSVTVMAGTAGLGRFAATNDRYRIFQNTPLSVSAPGVLGNDTEPNRKPLTAALVTGTSRGTVGLNPDGSFTYTPAAGTFGPDSFTYTASNGTAKTPPATVSLWGRGAVNDSYTTNQGSVLNVAAATGVLANDSSDSGRPLTAAVAAAPAHGTVRLNPDGSFTYTPAAGYFGADAFTYTASDGLATSNTATVALTVRPLPFAVNDQYTVAQNQTLKVSRPGLLANDLRLLPGSNRVNVVQKTSHGRLTIINSGVVQRGGGTVTQGGGFQYTPARGFSGQDSFTYTVTDEAGTSNIATVTLDVTAPGSTTTVPATTTTVPATTTTTFPPTS
jgi:hypothetical protein